MGEEEDYQYVYFRAPEICPEPLFACVVAPDRDVAAFMERWIAHFFPGVQNPATRDSLRLVRPARLHHITQCEYERIRAWRVRFYRTARGKKPRPNGAKRSLAAHKTFPYARYGSKKKALEAAIRWRDAEMPKHGTPLKPYGRLAKRAAGTGYIKRAWQTRVDRPTGEKIRYRVWMGWIRLRDGKSAHSHYSIPKWGDAQANRFVKSWFSQKVRECKRSR